MPFRNKRPVRDGDHFQEGAIDEFIERVPQHRCQTLVYVNQLAIFDSKYSVLQSVK